MKQIINDITDRLRAVYPEDEARSMAWWIAEELTGKSRTQLQFECKFTNNFANMQEIIDRLLHFEPIQYIFGHTLWGGLDLKVTPATLIPRPETAELVDRINARMANEQTVHVLDIGTGSGCIAIALKKAHPEWQVKGIDISSEAIEVARENARRNQAEVDFHVADIFASDREISGWMNKWYMANEQKTNEERVNDPTVNVIVSNPPYICEREKKDMRPNVLEYEPSTALFVPDDDPLMFYRRISSLRLGRHLFFEINESFAPEMKELLEKEGYTDIRITKDIYGKARVIECRMAE